MEEYPSAFSFVILLTYGFLGLEFVSRMLANPFGDEIKSDFNIRGMGSAAIIGIEEDSNYEKRWVKERTLRGLVQKREESIRMSTMHIVLDRSTDGMENIPYHSMEESSVFETPSVFL